MSERDQLETERGLAYGRAQAVLLGEYRAFRDTVKRALEAVDKAYAVREEAWDAYESLALDNARELRRRLEATEQLETVDGAL